MSLTDRDMLMTMYNAIVNANMFGGRTIDELLATSDAVEDSERRRLDLYYRMNTWVPDKYGS